MSTICIPSLRISGRATLDFWTAAFGAEVDAVYGEGDKIEHSQTLVCERMIMAGTGGGPIDKPVGNGSIYMVLDADADVDAIYARAMDAGAESVMEPYDADYGGHHCTVNDPDGHTWSFGTYRPDRAA